MVIVLQKLTVGAELGSLVKVEKEFKVTKVLLKNSLAQECGPSLHFDHHSF